MSLFEEYPAETLRRRSGHCCDALSIITRTHGDPPPWLWQIIHEIAHGRVPFSVDQAAAIAQLPAADVSDALYIATGNGWIAEVEAEDYMRGDTFLYVGRLARKR